MSWRQLIDDFHRLSTPLIADACVRAGIPLRLAPSGIRPLVPGSRVAGRVLPARHYGSVDIFLEAMLAAQPGDVLVIDNGGSSDEGCIGDLTVLEAQACGLSGVVVWGCHRDTEELHSIGFPVFSYGTCPAGPRRVGPRPPNALECACFGASSVSTSDVVFGDSDGVLFVSGKEVVEVLSIASTIHETERKQAEALRAGRTLRVQLKFDEYLAKRVADPSYTFRMHLRALQAAIEE